MLKIISSKILLLLSICLISISSIAQVNEELIDKNVLSEYFQNQQYTEAIKYLENKKVSASADLNLVNSLGYAYFMNEEYRTARQHYTNVLRRDSLNFTAIRYMALLEGISENYDSSLFYYYRIIKLQPANAWFYKLAGDTYLLNKQSDSALAFYSRAYRLQSSNVKIVYAYTDNLLDKQLFGIADSVLRIFLLTDSINISIMKLAIRSAIEQDKVANAVLFTNRWIRCGETDPTTSAKLALANYRTKNYEACYLVCDILLRQEVETESLLFYASQAMSKLNRFDKSNDLLRRCLDLAISKNTNLYYFSLADNFELIKNYKKTITAYDTAYYLFKDPLALYNIGRIYETGIVNKALAQQFYKKYLSVAKPITKDEKKVYAYVKEMLASTKKE